MRARAFTALIAAASMLCLAAGAPGAHFSSARKCGNVTHPQPWTPRTGRVYALSSGVSCHTAMRVARAAMKHRFAFGESVASIPGWDCAAALRPEAGYSPKYLVACTRGQSSQIRVGIK